MDDSGDSEVFALLRDQIGRMLADLDPREQEVLRLRFGLDGRQPHTLEGVVRAFGVTRERVRQIEGKALRLCGAGGHPPRPA